MTVTTEVEFNPFPDDLFDPPEITVALPVTGNGVAAIREWVYKVERYFGGQGMATCHYAALLGYHANLNTFRVELSDRKLAEAIGAHNSRTNGHAQRLIDAGFLVRRGKKRRERGTHYVLSEPQSVQL